VTTTTTTPKPTPTPAARVSADPGWVFRRAVTELPEASQADRDRHDRELVLIDTGDLSELRRDHPGLLSDTSPAQTLAAYARQADELAGMVEQYDTAHRRHITVLLHALGDLHVAMDELATRLDPPDADDGAADGVTGRRPMTANLAGWVVVGAVYGAATVVALAVLWAVRHARR